MSLLQGEETVLVERYQVQIRNGMDLAAGMLSNFLEAGSNFRILPIDSTTSEQDEPLKKNQAGICLKVDGALDGAILLLFADEDARRLAGLLMRREPPADLENIQMRSTLQEVGNIFASGVLSSLDDRLNLRALPSPPSFLLGTREQIEDKCRDNFPLQESLLVESRLNCETTQGLKIDGSVLFQVSMSSLNQCQASDG